MRNFASVNIDCLSRKRKDYLEGGNKTLGVGGGEGVGRAKSHEELFPDRRMTESRNFQHFHR